MLFRSLRHLLVAVQPASRPLQHVESLLLTNRWKLSDSTLRTLRYEVSNNFKASVKRGSALASAAEEAEGEAEDAERRRAYSSAASREVSPLSPLTP